MKKYFIIFLAVTLIFCLINAPLYARAGGGSSAGISGGGSSHFSSYRHTSRNSSPIVEAVGDIIIILLFIYSLTAFRIKLLRAKRNSKKIMDLLDDKDNSWKYKNIQKQVENAYFAIQNAWANQDMSPARKYMDEILYENFQMKLEWMKVQGRKNVMKKISLKDAMPVSLYDDKNDSEDYIWYFIKGSMIDYIIDINTNEVVEGGDSKTKTSFTEYWKFVRDNENNWVLAQILQSNEKDKITFQDKVKS